MIPSSRAAAPRATRPKSLDFALTRRPEGVILDCRNRNTFARFSPESIRDFMSFEQHAINCQRRLSMPRGATCSMNGWKTHWAARLRWRIA